MSQQVTIRPAKPYDISNLCRLLEQAVYGEPSSYPEPDQHMAINWVTSILNEGFVVVAEKSGRLIGTIAVTNYRFPWSPKWYLYVDWMFVSRSFREGNVFDGLLTAVHAYADEKKAPIFGGINSGYRSRLKDKLMSMKGYQYLGGQFIRDLDLEVIEDERRRNQEDEVDPDLHASSMD